MIQMGHPPCKVDDVEVNTLKHLITISFLAGTPIHRSNWQRVTLQLESMIGSYQDDQLATIVVECTIGHPLVVEYPRSLVYVSSFLSWLNNFWKAKNLNGSHLFQTKTKQLAFEIGYNTYFIGVHSTPVTLLESCEGITRGTTGLRTWGAASVLASWCLDNHQRIQGRVLELGAGIGFAAAAILSSPEGRTKIVSYTASDYHPHVLEILHHNLSLLKNIRKEESLTSLDERFRFCSLMNEQLSKEELEPGEYKEWPQMEDDLSIGDTSQVRVLQIDWRRCNEGPKYDVILAADVVYARHLLPYLVKTIREALIGREKDNCDKSAEKITEFSSEMTELSETKSRAYVACTRRNTKTISEFLSELGKQKLKYKEIYQTTLDREESVFSFDESHLPVKIYEIFHEDHS